MPPNPATQSFLQTLAQLPDGAAVVRAGRVVYANPALSRALGYELPEALENVAIADLVIAADLPRVEAMTARAVANDGLAPPTELRVKRADGRYGVFETSPMRLIEIEGSRAALVIARDLTERRRLQDQLMLAERMASLGTLAASVAHEINNPLAYVHLSLQGIDRLLAKLESGEQADDGSIRSLRGALSAAREGTDRVRTIVRDLRTFSRPDDELPGPVDVHAVIESAIGMSGKEVRHRAELVREYGHDVPLTLGSEARLGQVLLNLIVNAAQAMPDRPLAESRITVRTFRSERGHVGIEIEDNGPGMPPDVIERVFDPFFTTKPVGAGMGLGLAICHRIVTQLGGEIGIETSPGEGTCVRVTLPATEGQEISTPPPPRQAVPSARRGRLLVVDDEPELLYAIQALLTPHHDVVTVGSGREALDMLERDDRFDVVLCDLMMPEVPGMALYEELERRGQRDLLGRVVFMTGGAFTESGRRFIARVENACLEKPFDGHELLSLVAARVGA